MISRDGARVAGAPGTTLSPSNSPLSLLSNQSINQTPVMNKLAMGEKSWTALSHLPLGSNAFTIA